MDWPLPKVKPDTVDLCEESLDRMSRTLEGYVCDKKVAGIIAVVARRGKIAHTSKYGHIDIENDRFIEYDHIFRMYSNSKIVCAVAVLYCYERGLLQLRDPVSKYLPQFDNIQIVDKNGNAKKPKRPITIHDLLVHIGGLSYEVIHEARGANWSHEQFIDAFVKEPLVSEPGEQWNYSASNDVLGVIVEKVAGEALDLFLRRILFDPLQMNDTDFWVPKEKRHRFGPAYEFTDQGLKPSDYLNADKFEQKTQFLGLGGGLVSTASDYMKFTQMLLNNGVYNDKRIISRKSIELMCADHLPAGHPDIEINNMRYGLSVEVVTDIGRTKQLSSVGQFGWGGAACTQVWIDPQEDMFCLILTQLFAGKEPILNTFRSMCLQSIL